MEKRKKPIEPKEPDPMYYYGRHQGYCSALKNWRKDKDEYDEDLEQYEQLKLIHLIKNSTEDYCLRKLKITRR